MKIRLNRSLIIGACLTLVLPLVAADLPGSKDDPYVKRFDGSIIVRYKADNYDTLNFIGKDPATYIPFEGKMVRIAYRVPAGSSSSLEVFRNYEEELKAKGFSFIRDAAADDLRAGGDQSGVGVLEDLSDQQGLPDGVSFENIKNGYYIYGVSSDPGGTVHLSVAIAEVKGDAGLFKAGDVAIFVDSIQEKAVTNKMVDGTADDMAKQIAASGSVNLYGIYFDTDKTDIKPESKSTLDEVGKLLANDTTLKLKVVGHTDNFGTTEHNNDLSMRRAQSVVQALVTTYGVDASRLTPFGAGSTQPVASNDTDDGRAKNRRVELVKL
jgi:outer membrane protein OmpA-like peptidoglycan-associated protein